MAVGGALLVALGSTAAYAGGSTKTDLDNGVLYFEAHNGRDMGQSAKKVYVGEKFKKTGGSTVTARLEAHFEGGNYKDVDRTVKKGKSIHWSTSVPVSAASDCTAVGVMFADGVHFETPYIKRLC
ncbi:hypothetical protein [Streptomyces sp. bgisy100]|uniref:hypothetical protein n=1 Tax=Streptomyces sp. bgisy100 TaxID=3413783 RepID=UPI003D746478